MRSDGYSERKKVALLGIPDDALDVLNHYTQSSEWETVIVVNETPGSYATRMAGVLGIPVRDSAERDDLAECDLVIVGTDAGADIESIRSMLLDTSVEVADLDSASREMEFHPFADGGGRETLNGLGEEIDFVLEGFGIPLGESEAELPDESEYAEASEEAGYAGVSEPPGYESAYEPAYEPDSAEVLEEDMPIESEHDAPAMETEDEIADEVEIEGGIEDEDEDEAESEDEGVDDVADEVEREAPAIGLGPRNLPAPRPVEKSEIRAQITPPAPRTQAIPPAPRPPAAPPRPRPRDASPRFDVSSVFGRPGSTDFKAMKVNGDCAEVKELFQRVLASTGAKTASIMLPEPDGEHLAIAASVGLPRDIVAATRPRLDEGLVGRAYAGGSPAALGAEVPRFVEAGEMTYRLAASVPLRRHGRTIGVLSVNVESKEPISEPALLGSLQGLEADALDAVNRSVDLSELPPEARRDYLFHELDTIMATDASFPERLIGTAEALQRGIGADYFHVYLVDPLSQRLELISPPRGGISAEGRFAPLNRGFYSWVVDRGRLQLVTALDPQDGSEHGVAYLPVRDSRPYALLILEHFTVVPDERRGLEDLLTCVIEQLEELFEVEQGVESQDILAGLRMRIADKREELEVLPPALRAQPALEYGLSILGAEAAIWVEHPEARPIIAQPQTRQAARIVADAWDSLDTLCTWIREQGSTAWGGDGQGWDPGAPGGPVPYVGVRDERGGVLLAFFSSPETGPSSQLPARILIGALEGISELIPSGDAEAGPDGAEDLERAA